MILKPEQIIAERRMTLNTGPGNTTEVKVALSRPMKSANEAEYACSVQILGLGDEKTRSIYGVDSMQALQLALRFASQMLEDHRKNLRWLGNEDIGF